MVLTIQKLRFLALKIEKSDFFVLASPFSQNKPLSFFSLITRYSYIHMAVLKCYLLDDTF